MHSKIPFMHLNSHKDVARSDEKPVENGHAMDRELTAGLLTSKKKMYGACFQNKLVSLTPCQSSKKCCIV